MMKLFDLTGKKALVTGGSRGLGRAMAEGLLQAGADVAILSSSDAIFAAADELSQSVGRKVYPFKANMGERDQLYTIFDNCLETLGTLDILVTNHAMQDRYKAEEFPIDAWDKILEINLNSYFLLNQLAGRVMLEKGYGKIINIASLLSFSGGLTVPAYASAKGGVAQLTKALANEWAHRGVNVNAIAPGYMETELNSALIADPVRNRDITARIPAGRWGKPEDMQGVIIFLASAASDYVHGTVVLVDGGWMGR